MASREEFERLGNWLFRWRSYLPLFLIVLFIVALGPFQYLGRDPRWERVWEFVCLAISFFGLGIRIWAVGCAPRGSSGRNVKGQRATVLNTTGIYSLTRHPLYLGNFFIWLGIALSLHTWWLVGAVVLIFWLYYEKIIFAEEEFLRREYGDTFLAWAKETPVFLPIPLARWCPSELPFKFKAALRREYSGFFGIISALSLLKLVKDTIVHGRLVVDRLWLGIFLFSLVIYLTLMILKKMTKILDVKGR